MTVVREDDQKVLVVYRGVNDGVRWARPASEFYDGRFERVDTADQPTEPAQPATQAGAWDDAAWESWNAYYFKCAAVVSLKTWQMIWRKALEWRARLAAPTTEQPGDAEPFTLYTVSEGGYAERWIARKDSRGLIEPIEGPWRVTEAEARAAHGKGGA